MQCGHVTQAFHPLGHRDRHITQARPIKDKPRDCAGNTGIPRGQMTGHGTGHQAEAMPWREKKKALALGSTPLSKSWGTTISSSSGFGFGEEEKMQDKE